MPLYGDMGGHVAHVSRRSIDGVIVKRVETRERNVIGPGSAKRTSTAIDNFIREVDELTSALRDPERRVDNRFPANRRRD